MIEVFGQDSSKSRDGWGPRVNATATHAGTGAARTDERGQVLCLDLDRTLHEVHPILHEGRKPWLCRLTFQSR